MRIELAKILLRHPDMLLLDESRPTIFDIESHPMAGEFSEIQWLDRIVGQS
jgi:ABC-type Mn2+/Zn2+ transport system ATPase subunit